MSFSFFFTTKIPSDKIDSGYYFFMISKIYRCFFGRGLGSFNASGHNGS
jgi:hypothetical protein